MLRRFNLIEIDLDRYAWLCRLVGMPSAPTSYSVKRSTRFFHLTDRIAYGSAREIAGKFPNENQSIYTIWAPEERAIGEARRMTLKNSEEYLSELDEKNGGYKHLVISMVKPRWKCAKGKDIFDFAKENDFWTLMSFGIRGCNLDCYELVSGGEVLKRKDFSRFNFVRGIFGDR